MVTSLTFILQASRALSDPIMLKLNGGGILSTLEVYMFMRFQVLRQQI
jgi:hypothetical protein